MNCKARFSAPATGLYRRLLSIISVWLLAAVALPTTTHAQEGWGVVHSNYSGVWGMTVNPANIVDSRYKFDLNLFGTTFFLTNNYLAFDPARLGEIDFANENGAYTEPINLQSADVYYLSGNFDVMGPSFLLTLNDRSAIGFSTRFRNMITGTDLPGSLVKNILTGLKEDQLYGDLLNSGEANLQGMSWGEVGITYGRTLVDLGQHYIKAAVTVKYLHGLRSVYGNTTGFDYRVQNDSVVDVRAGDEFAFGYSGSFDFQGIGSSAADVALWFLDPSNPEGSSVGFDIGAVWEWRPRIHEYRYDLDGRLSQLRRDRNKYKLKVGFSLMDVGAINFTRDSSSFRYRVQETGEDVAFGAAGDGFHTWNAGGIQFANFDELRDSLLGRFEAVQEDPQYSVGLPTRLNLFVDYNITGPFYANLYTSSAFRLNERGVRAPSFYILTPRFEGKKLDLAVPIMYTTANDLTVGVGIRLGPVALGSNSIWTNIGSNEWSTADFYLGTRVSIPHARERDRDGDGVSDAEDLCPNDPGPLEFRGCPDSDGDHVPDSQDLCPNVPGLPAFHGCPDSDFDGIPDSDDQCPNEPGPPERAGCPDDGR